MAQTVLVVDDEPSQLILTQRAIEQKLSLRTVTAQGGAEAIAYLRSRTHPIPDIMLLDLAMPGVNGMEVIQNIRPLFPRLPIIVLTMYGDMEKSIAALHAGANDFLAKPVTLERLRISIFNLLRINMLEDALQGRAAGKDVPMSAIPSYIDGGSARDGSGMTKHIRPGAAVSLCDMEGNLRTLAYIERVMIELALNHHRGCMAKAARALGIGRSTLYRKIEEMQIAGDGVAEEKPAVGRIGAA